MIENSTPMYQPQLAGNQFRVYVNPNIPDQQIQDVFVNVARMHGMTDVSPGQMGTLKVSKGSVALNFLLGCITPYNACSMTLGNDGGGKFVFAEYDSMNICTGGGVAGMSRRRSYFNNFYTALNAAFTEQGFYNG